MGHKAINISKNAVESEIFKLLDDLAKARRQKKATRSLKRRIDHLVSVREYIISIAGEV